MPDEGNPNILDLLEELLAVPVDQREQRLHALAPEQRELLRKWLGGATDDASKLIPSQQTLLRALSHAMNPTAGGTLPMTESRSAHLAPTTVGPYHILEKLGEGGMGTVYKAEQLTPIRRIVAIKLIKPGFDTHEVIARFDSERQALARIDHPNIAKVLEAGADEHGRPYFAMEYIPGVPITQFADGQKLSIKQRLELFLQVCDAIDYSHTKAIIHRDIKATNVLAYTNEGRPTVKVIDFGIAKALTGDRLTDRTFATGHGHAIGSYDSMSPEQAIGSPDIDTRTDVYSLGALLYELLTGAKPFAAESLQRAADQEIRRIIREVEPPRPSTRFTSMGATATKIAQSRQAKVDVLAKQLRDELEWIPLKAMRKERQRRYASPLQLAEDVQNYLDQKPLLAGPETRTYLIKKYLHRHRFPVAVGMTIAALLIGIVGIALLYARAEHLRQRSDAASIIAQQARKEANQQAAVAETESHEVRKHVVETWSLRGIEYEQHAKSVLAMLSFARALEVAGSDSEFARIPRIQLNLLRQLERWPDLQLGGSQVDAHDATYSPDGRALICVAPPEVSVRDYLTGRRIATIHTGRDDMYTAAAMNAGQSLLAVAGVAGRPTAKGIVVVYDAYTQHELHRRELDFTPTHLTFSFDGKYILIESTDGFSVLDVSSFQIAPTAIEERWLSPQRTCQDGHLVVVSSNSEKWYRNLFVARTGHSVSSALKRTARIFTNDALAPGGSIHLLEASNVDSFQLSRSGEVLLVVRGYDGEFISLATLERPSTQPRVSAAYDHRQQFTFDQLIRDFDWNEQAHMVAFLLRDGTIQLYSDPFGGEVIRPTSLYDASAYKVRVSPDGQSLITFDSRGKTSVWSISRPSWKTARQMFSEVEARGSISSLNWDAGTAGSPIGKVVADTLGGQTWLPRWVERWDEYLRATHDGKWLVYATNAPARAVPADKTSVALVPVADPASLKQILIPSQPFFGFGGTPSVSERGDLLALPFQRELCETETGTVIEFPSGSTYDNGVFFGVSPDGKSATLVDDHQGIWRWDAGDRKVKGPYGGFFSSYPYSGDCVSPDGRWAIRCNHDAGNLEVWDASSGIKNNLIPIGKSHPTCIWTSENLLLVKENLPDGPWQLWNLDDNKCVATLDSLPRTKGWTDPTGRFLAAADDNKIQVYDLRERTTIGTSTPPQRGYSSVIVFPDGKFLLLIRWDLRVLFSGEVDVIDVSTGHQIFPSIPIDGRITGAVFPRSHLCVIAFESTIDGAAALLRLDLSESKKSPKEWMSLGEMYSNCRLDDAGVVKTLPYPEQTKRWLAKSGVTRFPSTPSGDLMDSSDLLDMSNKASALQKAGLHDQAAALEAGIVDSAKQLLLLGDARTISYQLDYADLLIQQKKLPKAESVLLDALSAAREVQDRGLQVKTEEGLANLYRSWQKPQQSSEYMRQADLIRSTMRPITPVAPTSNAAK